MTGSPSTAPLDHALPAQRLAGRVAVVTGAARGIGEGIARSLATEGARVAALDLNGDAADGVAQALSTAGLEAVGLGADVRDEDSLREAIETVQSRWGPVEIMVNNAAVNLGTPFDELGMPEWDDVLDVNLRGVLLGCQIAAAPMREAGFGRIINITSDAGQQPNEFVGAHYASSKAGVIGLTKVVARRLAPDGITVNAIAPAAIEGPIMSTLPPSQIEALRGEIPVGRFGTAEEVGALAVFLAGDLAGYITGATFDINGGQLMR